MTSWDYLPEHLHNAFQSMVPCVKKWRRDLVTEAEAPLDLRRAGTPKCFEGRYEGWTITVLYLDGRCQATAMNVEHNLVVRLTDELASACAVAALMQTEN